MLKRFFATAPGFGPYAVDVWGIDSVDARRAYAAFLGRVRCPKGTCVWAAD